MVKIYNQIDKHTDAAQQQAQQPKRNYLLIATILLLGLVAALFVVGPNLGLNLPCHGIPQPIFTNSTTQNLPFILIK